MATPSSRWKRRPEGSNWGDFGADDQLGRLNLITREKRLQGLAEAKEGLCFTLSLPLDYPGGNALNSRRFPPVLRPTKAGDEPVFNRVLTGAEAARPDMISDDLAVLHLQYSTQWDSFAHVGARFDVDGTGTLERVYYNGFRAGVEVVGPSDGDGAGFGTVSTSSANKLGVENMAVHGIQGRAVLVDLHARFGDARKLVSFADLEAVLRADHVVVEPGDILCLHTGFAEIVLGMNKAPDRARLHDSSAALDGSDPALLEWITASGIAAICADNYAVEAYPRPPGDAPDCSILPLHHHCLFKNGIPLGELWHLTPLARWLREHGRSRFLLTAPPLRLPGAVGSPVTPIATV
jgi:kynurenine formamidase